MSLPDVPVLETERLRLRGYRREEFYHLHALWSDPVSVRYITGKPSTEEESWARFLRSFGHWSVYGFGMWLIEDKQTGEFLGEMGFSDFRRDIEPSLRGTLEAGWLIMPEHHRKGYASEAVAAALEWAAKSKPGMRMTCIIDEANIASVRVAEKAGFKRVGPVTYHGDEVLLLERG